MIHNKIFFSLTAAAFVMMAGTALAQTYIPSEPEDGGRVVAETTVVGKSGAIGTAQESSDCENAQGYGVTVRTTKEEKAYLFDKDGKPCEAAEVLYDGRMKLHRRPPPLSMDIAFVDGKGPLPGQQQEQLEAIAPENDPLFQSHTWDTKLQDKDVQRNIAILSGELDAMEKMDKANYEPDKDLKTSIQKWQEDYEKTRERRDALEESEYLLATIRDMRRVGNNDLMMEQYDTIEELKARLRQAEKRLEIQEGERQKLLEQLYNTEQEANAQRLLTVQEGEKLRQEIDDMRRRVKALDLSNRELKEDFVEKEKRYLERIAQLSSDLEIAEKSADRTRQEMVLAAAKKVAEAEKLAFQAKVAQKEAMQREARRLKNEGDAMIQRAKNIKAGRMIQVDGLGNVLDGMYAADLEELAKDPKYKDELYAMLPLESVPLVLHIEDEPLEVIFAKAFKEMEPIAGKWKVKWELSDEARVILEEKWSVTAEARFDDFLDYVKNQVKELHNFNLNFKRFDRNKLFVISDS